MGFPKAPFGASHAVTKIHEKPQQPNSSWPAEVQSFLTALPGKTPEPFKVLAKNRQDSTGFGCAGI